LGSLHILGVLIGILSATLLLDILHNKAYMVTGIAGLRTTGMTDVN